MFYFRATGKYVSEEMRLLSVIFHRYKDFKKLARPVLNASSTMNLYFGVAIIQMLDFDEKNQMLTTLVWKKYVSNVWKKYVSNVKC